MMSENSCFKQSLQRLLAVYYKCCCMLSKHQREVLLEELDSWPGMISQLGMKHTN